MMAGQVTWMCWPNFGASSVSGLVGVICVNKACSKVDVTFFVGDCLFACGCTGIVASLVGSTVAVPPSSLTSTVTPFTSFTVSRFCS